MKLVDWSSPWLIYWMSSTSSIMKLDHFIRKMFVIRQGFFRDCSGFLRDSFGLGWILDGFLRDSLVFGWILWDSFGSQGFLRDSFVFFNGVFWISEGSFFFGLDGFMEDSFVFR